MTIDDSLNDYIGRTVKRYSSLFTLPSHPRLIFYLLVACTVSGVGVIVPLHPTYFGLALGFVLGIVLFLAATASNLIAHLAGLRRDPIFDQRRNSALSLYSTTFWLLFIFLGIIMSTAFESSYLWFKFFFIGLCGAVTLHLLVLSAVTSSTRWKVFFFSLLQPLFYAALVVFSHLMLGHSLDVSVLLFFLASLSISVIAIFVFMSLVNRVGVRILGVDSFTVFRAFLANWAEDLNAPLEGLFERFGVEQDIRVSAIAFTAGGRAKAIMIVPTFHAGPFKNVGSSTLPYTIQTMLEDSLHCVVSVPHGLSGHSLDLTSQKQNQKVTDKVLKLVNFSNFDSVASPFKRVQRNGASASCQIFGNCALVTLTLAPQTMEDLPLDLDPFIVGEAAKRGLSAAIAIDTHNSIEGAFRPNEAVVPLKEAVVGCLERALKLRKRAFEVGAAKVTPTEFSLRDGMGLGGITAVVTKVGSQFAAYVIIDGNNMVSGLREKILSALERVGINGGEVLTTDTHAVNGVVLTARGYHPVGEVMDQERLVGHIRQAVETAMGNLEPVEVGWQVETVSGVRVIGEKHIEAMCRLTDDAATRAKKLALSVFPIVGVIMAALLVLL